MYSLFIPVYSSPQQRVLLLIVILLPRLALHYPLLHLLSPPGVAASSFFTSGKYAIDPELRGAEFERITQNLDVHFWKTFWNITETEVLSVSGPLMLLVTHTQRYLQPTVLWSLLM